MPVSGSPWGLLSRTGASALLRPNELLRHLSERRPRSFDATALEDSEILVLARASLLPIIARNAALNGALMQGLCRRARRSEAMIQDAVFLGIGPRLARQLLRLVDGRGAGA